jgi:hypothetical protein
MTPEVYTTTRGRLWLLLEDRGEDGSSWASLDDAVEETNGLPVKRLRSWLGWRRVAP